MALQKHLDEWSTKVQAQIQEQIDKWNTEKQEQIIKWNAERQKHIDKHVIKWMVDIQKSIDEKKAIPLPKPIDGKTCEAYGYHKGYIAALEHIIEKGIVLEVPNLGKRK